MRSGPAAGSVRAHMDALATIISTCPAGIGTGVKMLKPFLQCRGLYLLQISMQCHMLPSTGPASPVQGLGAVRPAEPGCQTSGLPPPLHAGTCTPASRLRPQERQNAKLEEEVAAAQAQAAARDAELGAQRQRLEGVQAELDRTVKLAEERDAKVGMCGRGGGVGRGLRRLAKHARLGGWRRRAGWGWGGRSG